MQAARLGGKANFRRIAAACGAVTVAPRRDLKDSARVSETDPFSDAAFTSRLNKLISMLGSAQPEEADTARRKLIEHLGQYRLSFTDLAQRLRDTGERPSFTRGAKEMSLERQLAIARAAKQDAAAEAQAAAARAYSLEVELQRSVFEIGRLLGNQARARLWLIVAWTTAAAAALFAVVPHVLPGATGFGRAPRPATAQTAQVTLTPGDPFAGTNPLRLGPGEIAGTAAVQDLAIRLTPNDDANVRAFLNRGERVVIHEQVRVGAQTWFLIRTATGIGWVRAGDVEH
jgi:hypothetical protein